MRSPRCTFSAAAALNRIFIAPIEYPYLRRVPNIQPKTTHPSSIRQRSYASLPTAKQHLPYDDGIPYSMVRIVSAENSLSPPQYTSAVLRSLDRQTESLVVVALPSPPDVGSAEPSYAVCKILSKQAIREAQKARNKRKEAPSATLKTIELNWAIDPNDLKHRLERAKEFLSKGWRVDVVMAGKRRGRKATREEAETLVKKVREALQEVKGSKEWRAMEGSIGGSATMFLEGKQMESK